MHGQHSRSTGSLPGPGEVRMDEARDPTTRICKALPQFATRIHSKGISKGQGLPDKSRLLPQQRSQLPDSQFGSLALLGLKGFPLEFSWAPGSPRPSPYLPNPASSSPPQVSTWTSPSQGSCL